MNSIGRDGLPYIGQLKNWRFSFRGWKISPFFRNYNYENSRIELVVNSIGREGLPYIGQLKNWRFCISRMENKSLL